MWLYHITKGLVMLVLYIVAGAIWLVCAVAGLFVMLVLALFALAIDVGAKVEKKWRG